MNQQDRKVNEEILKSISSTKKLRKTPLLKKNQFDSPGIGYYDPDYMSIKKKSFSTFIPQNKTIKQEKELPIRVKRTILISWNYVVLNHFTSKISKKNLPTLHKWHENNTLLAKITY